MKVKFYVDRYTLRPLDGMKFWCDADDPFCFLAFRMGWVRATSDLGSLAVAENMKESLAARYGEDVNNFSIVILS